MSMETDCRTQRAVVWKKSGTDGYANPTVASPVGIVVRWELKQDETLNAEGQNIVTVATAVVDEDLDFGSIIWLGNILEMPADPTPLYEVVEFEKIPDVKGRNIRRVAKLIRYKDTLPELT